MKERKEEKKKKKRKSKGMESMYGNHVFVWIHDFEYGKV